MSDKKKKGVVVEERRRADAADSIQPPGDGSLARFLERECRSEQPSSIDVYPINRRAEKLERLFHYDIKGSETIGNERAAELATTIFDECQIYTDAFKKEHNFLICVIDNRRGGLAQPVATRPLHMEPRPFHSVVRGGDDKRDDEDDDAHLSAHKIMQESVKLIHDHDRFERENEGKIVGDVMLLMKDALVSREDMLIKVLQENKGLIGEFRALAQQVAERRVEESAVAIDAANAVEDRKDRQANRERDNLFSDVTRAAMLEGVKVLGAVFPGFGQLFLSHLAGQPPPAPPQLGATPTAPATPTAAAPVEAQATPAPPPVPPERTLVEKFIAAVEQRKIDETHTAAEKLFGKDDDQGNSVEEGVFSRAQVAILSGVRTGQVGVEALDAILPDSGKPEALTPAQLLRAMPFLTPTILNDVTTFMKLRKDARASQPPQ